MWSFFVAVLSHKKMACHGGVRPETIRDPVRKKLLIKAGLFCFPAGLLQVSDTDKAHHAL